MSNNIVMARVDARLVHGQVASRWTRVLSARKIFVIDNKTANDEFLSEVLLLASPEGVKVSVHTEEEGVKLWKEGAMGPENTILIFPNVEVAKRLFDAGMDFMSLNIGQSPKAKDRVQVCNTVQLSKVEIEKLQDMESKGVEVYFYASPTDVKKTTLAEVVEVFNQKTK